MRRKLLQALALASSALALSSCVRRLDSVPAPLAVDLPDICEQILKPVPLPDIRPDDDARVAFMRDDAALLEANDRIVTGGNCLRDQRRGYGGKGGPS